MDELAKLKKKLKQHETNWDAASLEKKELHKKLYYLENIISLMPGHVYWKNRDSVYLGCNNQMAKTIGLKTRHNLVGKTDYDLPWNKKAHLLIENDQNVMNTGVPQEFEERGTRSDGTLLVGQTNKTPLKNQKGDIIGVLGISLDITNLKKTEEKLKRAKVKAEAASHVKSEFIANMSHDIRTPITGMLGLTQALIDQAEMTQSKIKNISPSNSTQKTLHFLIREMSDITQYYGKLLIISTDELLQLCNEVLEIIRLDSGKMDEKTGAFHLHDLVQHNVDLLRPVSAHKQLELTLRIDKNLPTYLLGFRIYLDRIILNLLSNALKFTEKGYVHISIGLAEKYKKPVPAGGTINIQIIVEDTGIGIPKNKHKEIFAHFSRLNSSYQSTYKGSGLGLYSVKRYLEAMKGEVKIESEEKKAGCPETLSPEWPTWLDRSWSSQRGS